MQSTTTEEERLRRREYNKRTAYAAYHKYEKTKNGFLMRLYRNMQSRTSGIQKLKYHLYKGKTLLPREQFYEWAKASNIFHDLYATWQASGYDRKLTPSVNRIDSTKGYELDNMEWVTHSENSRMGSLSRFKIPMQ